MVSKSLRSKNFLFFPDASVTRKWGFKSHQMTWNYLPGQEQHYICSHKTDQLVLRRRLRVKSMLAWLMKLNAGRWMESSGWLLFELATKLLGIPKSQSILRFEQKSCSKTKAIVVGLPIFPIEFTCICSRFPLLRKQGGRKWMLWTKLANGIETRPHFSCSHLRGKLANGIENWWVWTKCVKKEWDSYLQRESEIRCLACCPTMSNQLFPDLSKVEAKLPLPVLPWIPLFFNAVQVPHSILHFALLRVGLANFAYFQQFSTGWALMAGLVLKPNGKIRLKSQLQSR